MQLPCFSEVGVADAAGQGSHTLLTAALGPEEQQV